MQSTDVSRTFLKYAVPSIVGMLIVALQTIIDGLFVSKGVGPMGLAAVNLSLPLINILYSIAIMIISGGLVISAIAKGQGDNKRCEGYTTLTFVTLLATCIVLSAVLLLNLKSVCYGLGSNDQLYPYVRDYLVIYCSCTFFYVIPSFTESFTRLREKPVWVIWSGVTSCVLNIVLDWLFVLEWHWGIMGAAIATAIANSSAAVLLFPLVKMGRLMGGWLQVKKIFFNGSSEMLTSVASAVTIYVLNLILMRDIGHLGVAALTIVFYFNTLVNYSIYGLSQALYPLMSFNLGAKDYSNIKNLLFVSMRYSFYVGCFVYIIILIFKTPLIGVFTEGNARLAELTTHATMIITVTYLFSFVNIIGSSFHTAIEKPLESVVIALFRSIILVLIPLFTLPKLFVMMGYEAEFGIWTSLPVGELTCLAISIPLMVHSMRKVKVYCNKK